MCVHQTPCYEIQEFEKKKNPYCVCVFVINEGEKLLRQLEKMKEFCQGAADVVVADGGSTDGSTDHEKLKPLGVNALLVKQDSGKLGSQMRMAFDWALKCGYEGVIVVDGNGKDGMEAIPRFVEELKKGVDHVQGSRFVKGGYHENTPKSRLLGLKLLHVPLMRLASGFKYTDTTNGFRAYSAKLLSSDKLAIFRDCFTGYELHYYLAIESARHGFRCSEIPVSRVYPATGKVPTKISGLKGNLNVIAKLLLCAIGYYRQRKTVPWKKLSNITLIILAAIVLLNILILKGFDVFLKTSKQNLFLAMARPCEKKDSFILHQTDIAGNCTSKSVLQFSIGKNRIIIALVDKNATNSCELQVSAERALFCNDFLLIESLTSNKTIHSEDIKKKEEFDIINWTIPTISDVRWDRGIAKNHNGFFLERDKNVNKIFRGCTLIIDNKEQHSVNAVRPNRKYIEIDVKGKINVAKDSKSIHTVKLQYPKKSRFFFRLDEAVQTNAKMIYITLVITLLEVFVFLCIMAVIVFAINLLRGFFRYERPQSSFPDRLQHTAFLRYCLIAIILSIFMTLTLFPGIIHSDSITRTYVGQTIFSYEWSSHVSANQSITSILLYGFSLYFFGTVAFVSILHGFIFFLSIFLVCDFLIFRYKTTVIAFLCICPFILGISVYHETSTISLSFMLLSYWLMMNPYLSSKTYSVYIAFIFLTVSLTLFLNFRPNAIALVPVFALFASVNFLRSVFTHKRTIFLLQITSIILACILSSALTNKFIRNSYEFSQPGFLWRGISVLKRIPANDYYVKYFDPYSETANATAKAIKNNVQHDFYGMFAYFPLSGCKKENTFPLIADLMLLCTTHPLAAFYLGIDTFLRLSGVPPLLFKEYSYNDSSSGEFYGIPNDSYLRKSFHGLFCSFVKSTAVFLCPWILIVSFIMLFLLQFLTLGGRLFIKNKLTALSFLFLLALTYNYAFLINAQSYEFRYAIPCTVTMLILNLIMLSSLLNILIPSGMFFLRIAYTVCFLILFAFQFYFLICSQGKELLLTQKSKPYILLKKDQKIKIFNLKNRLYIIADNNFDPDMRMDITFFPDTIDSCLPLTRSLYCSKMSKVFCGFYAKKKIFYYDFPNFPVKTYSISSPGMVTPIHIYSRPSKIVLAGRSSPPIGDLVTTSQVLRPGVNFDRRNVFVLTDGTDFAGRYICLKSGRKIRILSSKWYQQGKILYLEEPLQNSELPLLSVACDVLDAK